MNRIELVAYHEASHAMLHIHFQIPFDHVSIIPDAQSGGRVEVAQGATDIDLDELIKRVMTSYAGTVGEQIYCQMRIKKLPKSYFFHDGRADCRQIREMVQAFFPGDENEQMLFLNWVFHRTEQRVRKLWPQIERLARALLKKPVITYQELKQVNPILN